VEALREGEDETILREVIEMALLGDKSAVRFCANRIDAAARRREDRPRLAITRAETLDPFILHAKLVQAAVEGVISADEALKLIRLAAAKRDLALYAEDELTDEEYETLAEEPEDEEENDTSPNPPPLAGEGGDNATAREGGSSSASAAASPCPLLCPPPHAGEGETGSIPLPPCGGGLGWEVAPATPNPSAPLAQPSHPPVNHLFRQETR
jgi:hypothetical protein